MRIVPLELRQANELIARWHRHHKPVQGHRFSIGVVDDAGMLVGAATVGRPVSRHIDQHTTLEVTQLVTDGTKNACSILYAAAARIGREMGYECIQTYILESEPGTSLVAAGWTHDGDSDHAHWAYRGVQRDLWGHTRRDDQPTCRKQRWYKALAHEKE